MIELAKWERKVGVDGGETYRMEGKNRGKLLILFLFLYVKFRSLFLKTQSREWVLLGYPSVGTVGSALHEKESIF